MDSRLIALKLFLDELGIPDDTSTIENRKLIQKAVYLGQCAGADLGYRFGWHKMGPYSADLARDYYSLSDTMALGYSDYEGRSLQQQKREKLKSILPLMKTPDGITLSQPDWLELISSLHFMCKIRGLDEEQATQALMTEKPKLSKFVEQAREKLHEVESLGFNS